MLGHGITGGVDSLAGLAALCFFPGQVPIALPVAELSLGGAFIRSMKPPPMGSVLSLAIRCGDAPGLPPVDARVIGVRVDPADADRCGFEIVFSQLGDDDLETLELLVRELGPTEKAEQLRQHAERRRAPRVEIDLRAQVEYFGGSMVLDVLNISMTGALLSEGNDLWQGEVRAGTRLWMKLVGAYGRVPVSLKAEVVRAEHADESTSVGVRFVDVDAATARQLDDLIVCVVARRARASLFAGRAP